MDVAENCKSMPSIKENVEREKNRESLEGKAGEKGEPPESGEEESEIRKQEVLCVIGAVSIK